MFISFFFFFAIDSAIWVPWKIGSNERLSKYAVIGGHDEAQLYIGKIWINGTGWVNGKYSFFRKKLYIPYNEREGKEFELTDVEGLNNKDVLIKQREAINEKLGLATAKSLGINLDEMVTIEDIQQQPQIKTENNQLLIQDILRAFFIWHKRRHRRKVMLVMIQN